MRSFIKNNNEKLTLFIGLILVIIIFFTSWAGATSDKIPVPDKSKKELKAEIKAFNKALKELEAYLNAEEGSIYEIQQKVRFYDTGFNLIYETTQKEVDEETDKKALMLLRKSDLFMEHGEANVYMLL